MTTEEITVEEAIEVLRNAAFLGTEEALKKDNDAVEMAIGLLEKQEQGLIIELPVPISEECWVVINDKHIEKRNLNFDTFSAYGSGYIFPTKEKAEAKLKELKEKK